MFYSSCHDSESISVACFVFVLFFMSWFWVNFCNILCVCFILHVMILSQFLYHALCVFYSSCHDSESISVSCFVFALFSMSCLDSRYVSFLSLLMFNVLQLLSRWFRYHGDYWLVVLTLALLPVYSIDISTSELIYFQVCQFIMILYQSMRLITNVIYLWVYVFMYMYF